MKNSLLFIAFLILAAFCNGQTPGWVNYQAVIRDSSGQILTDKDVHLKFQFFKNGQPLFEEIDQIHTTAYGIANTRIGDGSPLQSAGWGSDTIQFSTFLSIDGAIYEPIGGLQDFGIVPFAFYSDNAKTAAQVKGMDMLFVGSMPVFGAYEGQAAIDGSEWQQVSRTLYEPYENFFDEIPVPPGMAREYYLLIDYSDNVAASSNEATQWRFWMEWAKKPGHQFALPSVWGNLSEGRSLLIKVPPIDQQVAAGAPFQHKYWRLEARVSGQFPNAAARVKSIQVVAYDVRGGQAPSVTLNTDFPGGKPGEYQIGGIIPAINVHNEKVGIGPISDYRVQIGDFINGLSIETSVGSPHAASFRFGDNSGWKLNFGRVKESAPATAFNTGFDGSIMTIEDRGRVGIGTPNPAARLHVEGSSNDIYTGAFINGGGAAKGILLKAGYYPNHDAEQLWVGDYTGTHPTLVCRGNGTVGINTSNPQAELDVNGQIRTKCVSVTGGCDLYERSKSTEEVGAGELVVSDSKAGFNFVKRATKAHDRKVVGVVSGGGGVAPGIELVMPGVLDGNVKIAIAGRVMVKTTGKVREGDLLTTSNVAGRAMAVKNFRKAVGAIVGKAISEPDDNGFVLMLINLQ